MKWLIGRKGSQQRVVAQRVLTLLLAGLFGAAADHGLLGGEVGGALVGVLLGS